MYFQGGYDGKTLTEGLGKHFEGVNVSIKPYPCCRGLHTYIDATLALVREQHLKAEEVKEIRLFSDEGGVFIVVHAFRGESEAEDSGGHAV